MSKYQLQTMSCSWTELSVLGSNNSGEKATVIPGIKLAIAKSIELG